MVDIAILIRDFLLTQGTVLTVIGAGNAENGLYAAPTLPTDFDPRKGPGVQIARAGGIPPAEIPQLINGRILLKVWVDKELYQLCSDVYGAIRDALHGAGNVALDDGVLMSALEVTGPQEMTDPDTGWPCIYAFYNIMARPN
jgi:hypothetical protein